MKILTVVGARPQFIKAAIVSNELQKSKKINEIILHTGQHYDPNMSDIFFDEMKIPKPKYNLNINGKSHAEMTAKMMIGIEEICMSEKPDFVLVYGDTNSTIAGALAAKKINIGVIHIEAGLRSYNMKMPEEINRIITDRISDVLFCPTDNSYNNLEIEGLVNKDTKVIISGDVMEDAAIHYSKIKNNNSIIDKLKLNNDNFILATFHRQENTQDFDKLKGIVNALNQINDKYKVIVPLHPRTKKLLESNKLKINFDCIEPVGYLDMIKLLQNCKLVLTDSGGLQKESFFFEKYCITLRNETEWSELVENNYNIISGTKLSSILKAFNKLESKKFVKKHVFYGGGNATKIIRKSLENLIE